MGRQAVQLLNKITPIIDTHKSMRRINKKLSRLEYDLKKASKRELGRHDRWSNGK